MARFRITHTLRYELDAADHVEAQIFGWQTHPYVADVSPLQVSFTSG